jgi:hypothetical protein
MSIDTIAMVWKHSVIRLTMSCTLACSLWLMLRMHYDHSLRLNIPVQIHGYQPSQVIMSETVSIEIAGPWKTLCNFAHKKPVVTITSDILRQGLQQVDITSQQLNLPATLHITDQSSVLIFVNPSR